jgi:hypothetical protein
VRRGSRATAALDGLDYEKAKTVSTLIAENTQKLGDGQRQAA